MSTTAPTTTLNAANAAIILVFGLFLFSIQDVIIKEMSAAYPVHQVLSIRGLAAIPILLLLIHRQHDWFVAQKRGALEELGRSADPSRLPEGGD